MSEELEHPECVTRPPVIFVTVENDVGIFSCTEPRHDSGEAIFVKVVAHDLVVEVERPIDFECAGNVAGWVE